LSALHTLPVQRLTETGHLLRCAKLLAVSLLADRSELRSKVLNSRTIRLSRTQTHTLLLLCRLEGLIIGLLIKWRYSLRLS
jgi:uncharacterized membrane protein YbjE (DUF340 family)